MWRNILILYILFLTLTLSAEDIDSLLSGYAQESDLSNITKIDSAGPVQIFTRDDLEKMQVNNLTDVINALSGIYLTRSKINTTSFARPTTSKVTTTYTRLYINDHDMSSPFFGSSFFIWGEMPIEYIDHIEVYTSSSSLDFGNENGAVIFRLYTKTAERDSGSKLRVSGDDMKSINANFYTADILDNDLSYFAYANMEDRNRKVYHNPYDGRIYDFKSDDEGYNLFANFAYHDYKLDLGLYKKRADNFIGLSNYMGVSLHNTPFDGDFHSLHNYIHLNKEFDGGFKLQLSYDYIKTKRDYVDLNGIQITNFTLPTTTEDYNAEVDEQVLSATLEKRTKIGKHQLLFGSFYKYKAFKYYGDFVDPNKYLVSNFSNALHLFSLYLEDNYNIDNTLRLSASIKSDFYRYEKDVQNRNSYLGRIGIIKSSKHFKYKFFYSKNYIPLAFYQTYNPTNTPYKANPDLENLKPDIYTGSITYETKNFKSAFEVSQSRNKKAWLYSPSNPNGWITIEQTTIRTLYQLSNSYTFDINNRIILNFTYGKKSLGADDSPTREVLLKSFNRYKKFDFYNALLYRSSYINYGETVPNSFDWTSSIKYHYSKDLSFGLRGENILNDAYEQAYKTLDYTIPSVDKKFWINMEYLF